MKFLREFTENIEILTEQTSSGKSLFLEGPFLQAEQKNRNGRIYPKAVMEKAVDKYIKDYINERRAIGELNHPDRPFPDPRHAAIKIESLVWDGNNVIGKASVLNTPDGQIIKALAEANYKWGVSSRGLGDIKERNKDSIVENYFLHAIDSVDMPSGQSCYVNPILESTEWNLLEDGRWEGISNKEEQQILTEQDLYNAIDKLINGLKRK